MKERYELTDNDCIIDNEKDVTICDVCDVSESSETLVNLLNQQDKEIKELKKENQRLKTENGTLKEKISTQLQLNADNVNFMENQRIENEQLHSQPKEIIEKIKNICCIEDKCEDGSFVLGINEKDLDAILKEYDS